MNARRVSSFAPLKWVAAIVMVAALPCVPAAEQSVPTGAQLYQRYCASCHGMSGVGNGPSASIFKRPPPDLTQMALRNGGTFPMELVTRAIAGSNLLSAHGSRDMPVWGMDLALILSNDAGGKVTGESGSKRVVDYLASIQQKDKR